MVINTKSGAVEVEHDMPAPSLTDRSTVHGQFRRLRMTASGTYLAPFLTMGKVVEYDRNFNEIWSYSIPSPWAAIRLRNAQLCDVRDLRAHPRAKHHAHQRARAPLPQQP